MSELDVLLRALAAILAGGAIGLERAYRGRAAGMRTNALVGFGAALVVAASEFGGGWVDGGRGDPTRVIQGIVTGIGFLGAGVIVKEGFSVRGLTTAASVWVVAAIGVLFGEGLYRAGAGATLVAWAALELMRRIENRVPVHAMVHCEIGYRRDAAPEDSDLVALVARHGFRVSEVAWRLDAATQRIEFELSMWSTARNAMRALERALRADAQVASFRITPARD